MIPLSPRRGKKIVWELRRPARIVLESPFFLWVFLFSYLLSSHMHLENGNIISFLKDCIVKFIHFD
jgi:hypothetical protein